MDTSTLKPILEAALLASGQPLTLPQLEALFADTDADPVRHEDIVAAMDALRADCADRGIELVEVASGYRFQIRQDVHAWVAKLWTERPSRYSRAMLETLALIAYRQPVTRGEIEQVRGVTVSSHIIKTLEEREWIRVVGHRDTPGRPALLGTTRQFLDYFNLKSLDELPSLPDILNLEAMDPQLALDGDNTHAASVGAPPPTVDASTDDADADAAGLAKAPGEPTSDAALATEDETASDANEQPEEKRA